jgi:threonine dehydratase
LAERAFCFHHFKFVCKPGEVVGMAAILENPSLIKNCTVVICITGGNLDQKRFLQRINPYQKFKESI